MANQIPEYLSRDAVLFIYLSSSRICLLIFRKRERNTNRLPPICARTGNRTHNPSMCSDQESNPKLSVSRKALQPRSQGQEMQFYSFPVQTTALWEEKPFLLESFCGEAFAKHGAGNRNSENILLASGGLHSTSVTTHSSWHH